MVGPLLVILILASYLVATTSSGADGATGGCNLLNPSCTVGTGGGAGNGGDSGGNGVGLTNADPCDPYPDAAYGDLPPKVSQACAGELAGAFCSAIEADILTGLALPGVANLAPAQTAVVNKNLALNGCPSIVTAATLAQQAFDSISFPLPSGRRSPSEARDYNGYPMTYVGLWTYYWTDRGSWKPLIASASAAGLTATVTAVPVSLSFDPGDGAKPLSCAGPGRPWAESDGNNAPGGGACGYQYPRVTGPGYGHPITSTQTIDWAITWTGTGNTGGEIPGLVTSTSGQLNVLQIRTVNR